MIIAISADDAQWNELTAGVNRPGLVRVSTVPEIPAASSALIVLQEEMIMNFAQFEGPVLVNAVCNTLPGMNASPNIVRMNGWNSFISRQRWELSGKLTPVLEAAMDFLEKKILVLPDEPGFVSARVVSMIINEAYFALGDQVGTREAIDTAMKLGTNYPYGPFEWGSVIGIKHIYNLLNKLSASSKRYLPAPLLIQDATA